MASSDNLNVPCFPMLDYDEASLIYWIREFIINKSDSNDAVINEIVSKCDILLNAFYMDCDDMIEFQNKTLVAMSAQAVKAKINEFVDISLPFIIAVKDYAESLKSRGAISQYEIRQIMNLSRLALKIKDIFSPP